MSRRHATEFMPDYRIIAWGLGAHGETIAETGAVGHQMGNGALLVDAGE